MRGYVLHIIIHCFWGFAFLGDINESQFLGVIAKPFLGSQEVSCNHFNALLLGIAHLEDLGPVALPEFAPPSHPYGVTLLQNNKTWSHLGSGTTSPLPPYSDRITFLELVTVSCSARTGTNSSVEASFGVSLHEGFPCCLAHLFSSGPRSIGRHAILKLAAIRKVVHAQVGLFAEDSLGR